MPHRIRDVLLISSEYDAFFLESDGPLAQRLFTSYAGIHLTWAPRITHAASAAAALELLGRRDFQLVIVVPFVDNDDGSAVGIRMQIRVAFPGIPIVVLAFNERQLEGATPLEHEFDEMFLWTGDAGILTGAVKLIEDRLNLEHDVAAGDVQLIVVVEDRPRAYSTFLSLLYPSLMRQSYSLLDEGLNEWHRSLRIHARPKIALAKTYESAIALCERWRANLMGVMSDVSFPRGGKIDDGAGVELARAIRNWSTPPPVLLQSTDASVRSTADALGAWFVDKNAPDFMSSVRGFLEQQLGFGDFVFRLPNGNEVDRARNLFEMADVMERVPIESLVFHSGRHDFSRWLKARAMFSAAKHCRGLGAQDFKDPESIRRYLLDVIQQDLGHDQEGVVADFNLRAVAKINRFVRLGKGSIGGKARSLSFISALLAREKLIRRFPDLEIRIPKTIAISVEEFDRVIEHVGAKEMASLSDAEIRQRIMDAPLSEELLGDLWEAYQNLKGPLAVRSSSLLEDARFQPFAGVYSTYMLPNNHPDPQVRFDELGRAIRAVYASMFGDGARTYAASNPHTVEEEKMGVLVQQIVGQAHGNRFYPDLSGVCQSYNYYPIGSQRAEDGVAVIALGMGQMVVEGGSGLRFCPKFPTSLPQFPTPKYVLRYTQKEFYALDLDRPVGDLRGDPDSLLQRYDLLAAEEDGTLALAGSVYSGNDDAIRENLALPGPRVVTFNNIIRWRAIPLADALLSIMEVVGKAMGGLVEIEFAVDMVDWKRPLPAGQEPRTPRLYVLQVRPMTQREDQRIDVDLDALPQEETVCRTRRSLGNGRIENIRDVVFVRNWNLSGAQARAVAEEIRQLDAVLRERGRRYLLIGPGRWGSSDEGLGIPVEWLHIANAQVIVEVPLRGEFLEASQGTHFFHNVTSARLGYLTVTPQAEGVIDRDWLEQTPAAHESELLRHLELDAPLRIFLDGRAGQAAVLRPGYQPKGE